MRLKERAGDFRVRELLAESVLLPEGEYRLYRLTKRKLTTPEAVRTLADLAGVDPREVAIAGLKDRQGITIQHASVHRGRDVRLQDKNLKIETAGFADHALSSEDSRGNAFEIWVRGLDRAAIERLRAALPLVRDHGVINYFDDQRFGNLEFGQGWIARDLMLGQHEHALRVLLASASERDDDHHRRFKAALDQHWGDWRACRDVAGRFGAHHSVFEHLQKTADDFAGAFEHIATRLKLIHLFAYQSHLWNRAVADLVRAEVPLEERLVIPCVEGTLVACAGTPPPGLTARASFPLPGPGLEEISDERAYGLIEDVLAQERLVPDRFRIEGMPGFQLRGEERALFVRPEHLRVRPAEQDGMNPGLRLVRVRFDLPRGAYATLVVKRLLALRFGEDARELKPEPRRESRGDAREERRGGYRDGRHGEQRGAARGRSWGDSRGDSRNEYRNENRNEYRGESRGESRGAYRGEYRGDQRGDQRGDRAPGGRFGRGGPRSGGWNAGRSDRPARRGPERGAAWPQGGDPWGEAGHKRRSEPGPIEGPASGAGPASPSQPTEPPTGPATGPATGPPADTTQP